MKIIIRFCCFLFFAVLLLTDRHAAFGAEKLKVVATLFPTYDFARAIARDRADIILLLAPGMEAHAFEPRPRDILRINEADVFIYTGKYMEPWVADVLRGVSNKNLLVVDASGGIQMIPSPDGKVFDPHIWLDFSNAKVMVANICAGLAAKDPPGKALYEARAAGYQKELDALDEKFRRALTPCTTRVFITTGHAAFGYFAQRYGLRQVSAYRGYSANTEPTPRMMDGLIRTIQQNGVRVVYYEELLSPKLAQAIAHETGAKLLPLSAAHNVSKDDFIKGVSFLSMMNQDLQNLQEGLQCRTTQ